MEAGRAELKKLNKTLTDSQSGITQVCGLKHKIFSRFICMGIRTVRCWSCCSGLSKYTGVRQYEPNYLQFLSSVLEDNLPCHKCTSTQCFGSHVSWALAFLEVLIHFLFHPSILTYGHRLFSQCCLINMVRARPLDLVNV